MTVQQPRLEYRNRRDSNQAGEVNFLSLLDQLPGLAFIVDSQGFFLHANELGREFFGHSIQELKSRRFSEFVAPDYREILALMEDNTPRKLGVRAMRHVPLLNKDGTLRWMECCPTQVALDGRRALLVTAQDVTESQRRERAFGQLAHRLGAAATADQASRIIVGIADELFGWDACFLHLFSPADEIFSLLTIDTVDGRRVEFAPSTFSPEPSPMMRHVTREGGQLVLRTKAELEVIPMVPFGDRSRRSASMMHVPIHNGDKILGVLSIQSYTPQVYTENDLASLQALADHCGAALERIGIADRLRRREASHRALLDALPDWMFRIDSAGVILDVKTVETDETSFCFRDAVGRMLQEIWPPSLAEKTLGSVQQTLLTNRPHRFEFENNSLTRGHACEARVVPSGDSEVLVVVRNLTTQREMEQQLLEISAQERERIGKDLHDDLGQLLTGIGYLAQALRQQLEISSPDDMDAAKEISVFATLALSRTRMLSRGLFPTELAAQGLQPALCELAQQTERLFKIHVALNCDSSLDLGSPAGKNHLYRLVQEAVSNAVRHGQASRVEIHLAREHTQVFLRVIDNGSGFNPGAPTGSGLGLRIMQYRARALNASLELRRHLGGGMELRLALPEKLFLSEQGDQEGTCQKNHPREIPDPKPEFLPLKTMPSAGMASSDSSTNKQTWSSAAKRTPSGPLSLA